MSKNIWRRWWVKLWIKDVFKEGGILDKMDKEAVCTFFLLFAWSGDTRIMRVPGTIDFDGIGLSEEQYCHKLRMTAEKFREMTKILCENEMITYEKGIITIVNFSYWQDKKIGEDKNDFKNETKNEVKNESKNEVKKLRSKEVRSKNKEKNIVNDDFSPIITDMIDCWNKIPGVSNCVKLTEKREKAMRLMLLDDYYRENWKEGMRRAFRSDWLTKRKRAPENDNWTADIDWFMRKDGIKSASLLLILEGKYDNDKMGGK